MLITPLSADAKHHGAFMGPDLRTIRDCWKHNYTAVHACIKKAPHCGKGSVRHQLFEFHTEPR